MPAFDAALRKLDANLSRLVNEGHLDTSAKIPVFISPAEDQISRVIDAVQESGGDVRHVLDHLYCVAAWLPLGSVQHLAKLPFVREMEMSQPVGLA